MVFLGLSNPLLECVKIVTIFLTYNWELQSKELARLPAVLSGFCDPDEWGDGMFK
jgi:hypothetical protein